MATQGVTIFCFGASYGMALGLEMVHLFSPSRLLRVLILLFSSAGLLAHTIYLAHYGWPLQGAPSSFLFLSWILAVFYLGGALHHGRMTWGIFVLPVVLGLVLLAGLAVEGGYDPDFVPEALRSWAWLHFVLLLLGSVGLSVAFVSSVMYLVQSYRLRHKTPPGEGVRLLSLERLETMHRRAVGWAFLLFTAGLLIGVALLWNTKQLDWWDPKVVSTLVMWVVFAVLTHLRYLTQPQGRKVAVWTIVAFGLMVVAYAIQFVSKSGHPSGGGL